MSPNAAAPAPDAIVYPESDGLPMADNTRQARWIVVLFGNLAALFRGRQDVFIGSNLFWYPVEGEPQIRIAPDVLAAFGRPKGDRGSYKQWEEGDIPLTVVFEVLSPSNTHVEMEQKRLLYEEYGVEEYYVYDPDANTLMAYVRRGDVLVRVRDLGKFVSPRLGIRFDLSGPELVVFGSDGRPFLTFEDLTDAREEAERRADDAQRRADDAHHVADDARRRAEDAERRMARLAELSRKARRGLATAEELTELDGFEAGSVPPPP